MDHTHTMEDADGATTPAIASPTSTAHLAAPTLEIQPSTTDADFKSQWLQPLTDFKCFPRFSLFERLS